MTKTFDTLIIGAGAAGLFCGGKIAQTGRSVCVIDHARKPAEKVRISGGGRCNFTNIHTSASNFLSENPHFAKSALARYTPWDFCDLMTAHDLSWSEKTLGQLFCDQRSGAIINMLVGHLKTPGGDLRLETSVQTIDAKPSGFTVQTPHAEINTRHLVIATGGLSIPKMGATGFAYDIARQFGHTIVPTRPALVPFTFSGALKESFASLSGVATPASVTAAETRFTESLLFTHRGLSGPSILQASSYWPESTPIQINLLPEDAKADKALIALKSDAPKRTLSEALSTYLPKRLIGVLAPLLNIPADTPLGHLSNKTLQDTAAALSDWHITPTGTEGWRTAEVTVGGVATRGLSSKTMQSQHQNGLYFIGECVDVTGWLGGYNFQWAWASAAAAAEHINSL